MKNKFLIFVLFLMSVQSFSQEKYLTKEGFVSFFSHTLVEDIKADNFQVLSVIDKKTGEIEIQLLMKSFMFKKALMQEHFNESYIESHKYPKATFKGFIANFNELESTNTTVEIIGILSVHGKEKEIKTTAKLLILKDQINISGNFMADVADFDINIPTVVINNIAKTIKVSFDLQHKPYK
ncbi:YceI family protein [Lutibacter sp.]|uniref:YceI family protein n=1 Tax=Lutibacter sp. TaxID=1925666 RepID=UPI002735B3F2|nr:YceI family protein [Lutibacter sp.]MDP3312162.1 YceI family protein [Lutibacter sp.]